MRITEKKKIKIDHECKDFPIYLTWLNSLGGYSYWLFFKEHQEKTKTASENKYIKSIADLENAISTNDITGKAAANTILIGGRMKAEDMDGIEGLYQSPKVLRLMNPETWETDSPTGTPAPIWQRVIIKPGSLTVLKTGVDFLEVKITLELPFINTQKE
jgi:hypothetical protein